MHRTRVPKNAVRRLGIFSTSILFCLSGLCQLRAAQVVITVKGTVNGGYDQFHIFVPKGNLQMGTPFTLVFTFDDAKGAPMKGSPCPNAGSGIAGTNGGIPGTAVLTILGKSHTFGTYKNAVVRAWRSTNSQCSRSEIGISIQEGDVHLPTAVQIKIHPNYGRPSLTQDPNWRHPLKLNNFDARNGDNAFAVRQPGNYTAQTMSYLSVDTLEVQ